MDILIAPVPKSGRRTHIEREMRDAIREGRLGAGTALPSSRTLAVQLGVSRGTVVEAYAQLVAEGYVDGRQGGAMTVAGGMVQSRVVEPSREQRVGPKFDLRPGTPDPGAFPAAEWLGALRRVLRDLPADATGYGDPRGRGELRAALAATWGGRGESWRRRTTSSCAAGSRTDWN